MRYGGILALLAVWLGLAAGVGGAESGAATAVTPSKAWRLTLEKFTPGGADMVVMVFVREGKPAHAYAVVPSVDQTLHRVDLTPAAPIEYIVEGTKFDPPEKLKSNYDYKNTEFVKYRGMYEQGKIVMRNHDMPTPVSLGESVGAGVLDLFLDAPDALKRDRFRVQVSLKGAGRDLTGTYKAHDYHAEDEDFRPLHGSFEGKASARELGGWWEHTPDRAFAQGADWPQQHGPTLTGSAIDCQRELVDNIADARLLWVADMPIPGGRGGIPRSPFGFFPINNTGLGLTQYSAPIVADGKVYLAVPYVDEAALAAVAELKNNPRVIRGVDPRALADELSLMRDTLFCIDAQTGRTLWMFQDPRKMSLVGESKSGRGLTAVHHKGKIIFRGQASLYGVDAQTGKLLWQNNGQKAVKNGDPGYGFGVGQSWSTDHSPTVVDGVVVVRINDTPKADRKAPPGQLAEYTSLMGFDPDTGKALWRASNVTGRNAIATSIVLEGKPYIIATYSGAEKLDQVPAAEVRPEQIGLLSLIEPKTGKIVWQKPIVGGNSLYPLVWNDTIATSIDRVIGLGDGMSGKKASAVGGVRVSPTDAKVIWTQPKAAWQGGRTVPIAHHGYFITETRATGFQAMKADTGEIVGQFPHIYTMAYGSHNWTWTIASNDRVFTSGAHLLMFRLKDGKMELMPGSLPVDLASGYICPIRPAIADGRLFVRTGDGLACYDVRKPVGEHKVDAISLKTSDLALGMANGAAGVELQIRLVNLKPSDLVVRYPAFQNTGVPRPYAWGGINAMRWRSAGIPSLAVEGNRIHGRTVVAVNEQREVWNFDLTRNGDRVAGTGERTIPPMKQPLNVKGDVVGDTQALTSGAKRYSLRLAQGGINNNRSPQDVTVYLEKFADGTIRAYAASGRINQASFEVDPTNLKFDGDRITGPITVIFHSDRYGDIHPDVATSLAATYTVDLAATKNEAGNLMVSGTYAGVLGVEYRKAVPVAGQWRAGQDLRAGVEADAASDPAGDADEGDKE